MNIDIDKVFQRIKFNDEQILGINYKTLSRLQQAFLLTVPFENLDMHYTDKNITVSPEMAYEKIILKKRGGFCYECNSLFYTILEYLGFDVELLSARTTISSTVPCPEWGHMCIRVRINELNYIVDVGNGQSFRTPLLENGQNETYIPEGFFFRFGPHIEGNTLYMRSTKTGWQPRFHLSPISYTFDHYHQMCEFWQVPNPQTFSEFTIGVHHTHANLVSSFVKGPMATLATENGRIFATREKFTQNTNGVIQETIFKDEIEFFSCLKDKFGLVI